MSARAQARLVRVLRDREVFNEEVRERVSLAVRVIASADGLDHRGARRRTPSSGPLRAAVADPHRCAGAAPAARRHPGAGDALPQGAVPGQRHAAEDPDPAGADAAGGAPVARQRAGAQGTARTPDPARPAGADPARRRPRAYAARGKPWPDPARRDPAPGAGPLRKSNTSPRCCSTTVAGSPMRRGSSGSREPIFIAKCAG